LPAFLYGEPMVAWIGLIPEYLGQIAHHLIASFR
jgi:hypothetical protein